jgi:transaldolase/glucose-6-phosphate isomerase
MNPLKELQRYGQSVWLDYIRRSLLTSGELRTLLAEDGLMGVTSNPAIFEKAIAGSTDYSDDLARLQARPDLDAKAVYEALAIRDIQDAADVLRPLYESTRYRDGYVSLEVSPDLAHDTTGTLAEATRLWREVGRPNVMIKVPATPAGVPAIETLIAEGINVNVTLLFAREAYERVAEAYTAGLERLVASGGDPSRVASVASFFISRIDALIDSLLAERIKGATDAKERAALESLQGKVAIANAKLTYARAQEIHAAPRWAALAARGAQVQRLLWASTSTKNPSFRDVVYVEELIGPDTVNTIPPATFDAFRDHGKPRPSLTEDVDGARAVMERLGEVGISMKEVTDRLLSEGVKLFSDAFAKLLAATAKHAKAPRSTAGGRQTMSLPADLQAAVDASLNDWETTGKVRRLWARDASLWTGWDESDWLGWLGIVDEQIAHAERFRKIAQDVKRGGFSHILLLGMGGSSLCPEVMVRTFGPQPGFPTMHVLDSTDPAQVLAFEQKVDLARTLCIVSSKSGTTLEPNIFKQYFYDRMVQAVGLERAGQHFIAITDPGSKMAEVARADHFCETYYGLASIGGRYSALSDFGMVPAAAMGVDVPRLLEKAEAMAHACASSVPVRDNPGLVLGTVMGVLAQHGRDKVTLIASPAIDDLGAWLEQLLAESTGKKGRGLVPVDREPLGVPAVYSNDRLFVYLRLTSSPDAGQDAAVAALEKAGQPVVRIAIAEPYDIGAEFFRWEFATAVAGAIIGINAFDQPDVEASKIATRKLTTEYEQNGRLPDEKPILEEGGLELYADARNTAELVAAAKTRNLAGILRAHLGRIGAGDYAAVLAYMETNTAHDTALQSLRVLLRDRFRVATCLGFGPRFLHSTGQAYKGGPNSGVFLQLTCDDAADLLVPGQTYTFGVVKAAQARGDFEVLAERGRRALRVHLPADVGAGLEALRAAIEQAME